MIYHPTNQLVVISSNELYQILYIQVPSQGVAPGVGITSRITQDTCCRVDVRDPITDEIMVEYGQWSGNGGKILNRKNMIEVIWGVFDCFCTYSCFRLAMTSPWW